jgi:hypothetical protein
MKRLAAILILSVSVTSCVVPIVGQASYEQQTESVTAQEELLTEQPTDEEEKQLTIDEIMDIEPMNEESQTELDDEELVELAIAEMNEKMELVDAIDNTYEWFIAYKALIKEYEGIIDPPETIYDCYTDEELDLFFRVVQSEIGSEKYSFEQKCNVASVILNRIEHERFGNTMNEVLIPSQFAAVKNGRYKKYEASEMTILACEYVFSVGDTTNGCLFFDSNNSLKYQFVYNDGAHNFYKLS